MPKEIFVTSILNKKKKRDSWFLDDYTVNPYEGCGFNCLYCYVRGSKFGENMEEGLAVKINALSILEKQLASRAKKNVFGIITLASATDAYTKLEEKYEMSRAFLELFLKYKFPVHVITKSTLVARDIDLLKQIDKAAILPHDLKTKLGRGVIISFSVSTLNKSISDILEPGAPSPQARLHTMKQFKQEGFLTGLNCMPLLPFLSDSEEQIEEMISTAKTYGADYILGSGLTLFGNAKADSKTLYFNFLQMHYPHILHRYKDMYGLNSFPPVAYKNKIDASIKKYCLKYSIRDSIL